MKLTFRFSHLAEYQKILYSLSNIRSSFYRKKSLLLTQEGKTKNPLNVIVPRYKLVTEYKFWEELDVLIKDGLEDKYYKYDGTEIPTLFAEVKKEAPINPRKSELQWAAIEKDFWEILNKIFKCEIAHIDVFLTRYGTRSTYCVLKNSLIIYLRDNIDLSELGFCIISYFIINSQLELS